MNIPVLDVKNKVLSDRLADFAVAGYIFEGDTDDLSIDASQYLMEPNDQTTQEFLVKLDNMRREMKSN
ncbi:hypothetical protein BGZ76_005475 [Entomortierella beljakovae]|nr:hypothetical protein BGZ76_005475 [Entomortierella beljakovae]